MAASEPPARETPQWNEILLLSIAKYSGQIGLGTGVAGAALVGTVGLFKSNSPGLFALASGVKCFTLGFCFTATRTSYLLGRSFTQQTPVADLSPSDKRIASTLGGAGAGAITASLFRGRANVVPGIIVWSALGISGQFAFDIISPRLRDQRQGQSNQSLLERITSSKWSPMTKISDEDYEEMLQERLVRIEAEIAVIDDDIAKLKSEASSKSDQRKK